MFTLLHHFLLAFLTLCSISVTFAADPDPTRSCVVRPLGPGFDDTDQVEAAIAKCGQLGTTTFEKGSFNITRKMTWNLVSAKVDLNGFLNFPPNITYWLQSDSTYRVVFIQSQASWFVVTGSDFVIDAHDTGGIQGNGQTWWSYFATHARADGDGRPISLTVWNATRGVINNFRIESPPFWSSAISESSQIVMDGMFINATNEDPLYVGKNVVPNTDGTDTFRSDRVSLLNWDVTCGDDCLAIKGNSSNLVIRNITCRGGNGIAVGSLGQYIGMNDFVTNVDMEDLNMIRLNASVQPNMVSGVYLKTWDGTANGLPPTGGGGAGGFVSNISARNVRLDRVTAPVHLYQTNNMKRRVLTSIDIAINLELTELAYSGDALSTIKFQGLSFENWSGTAVANKIVDIECSSAGGCSDISFAKFSVTPPAGQAARFICQNTAGVTGLSAPCNSTGLP